MRDFQAQLRAVLGVYLDRGLFALDAMAADDDELLIYWMKKRKAAFFNLVALDHDARNAGVDWMVDSRTADLARRSSAINARLEDLVKSRLEATNEELQKMRGVRRNLGKFHSGQRTTERISKSI